MFDSETQTTPLSGAVQAPRRSRRNAARDWLAVALMLVAATLSLVASLQAPALPPATVQQAVSAGSR